MKKIAYMSLILITAVFFNTCTVFSALAEKRIEVGPPEIIHSYDKFKDIESWFTYPVEIWDDGVDQKITMTITKTIKEGRLFYMLYINCNVMEFVLKDGTNLYMITDKDRMEFAPVIDGETYSVYLLSYFQLDKICKSKKIEMQIDGEEYPIELTLDNDAMLVLKDFYDKQGNYRKFLWDKAKADNI